MTKTIKTIFQDIHYSKIKPSFLLNSVLSLAEVFYKGIINFKNFLYEKEFLKESCVNAQIICVGN